jgi:hypothetical protein
MAGRTSPGTHRSSASTRLPRRTDRPLTRSYSRRALTRSRSRSGPTSRSSRHSRRSTTTSRGSSCGASWPTSRRRRCRGRKRSGSSSTGGPGAALPTGWIRPRGPRARNRRSGCARARPPTPAFASAVTIARLRWRTRRGSATVRCSAAGSSSRPTWLPGCSTSCRSRTSCGRFRRAIRRRSTRSCPASGSPSRARARRSYSTAHGSSARPRHSRRRAWCSSTSRTAKPGSRRPPRRSMGSFGLTSWLTRATPRSNARSSTSPGSPMTPAGRSPKRPRPRPRSRR